ncbi:conditioned medium-induced protein 4 [Halorhabdus tiamatea SARL4B]|uniref:Conditioned medium-induced protein 4 n=1 Tax=Halorhabdus tiamatea SARL4B TaxID=1033806 RepID=F7PNX9_9EURY|nr:hypothetical protein [Halorhabdus tiamatea]ERJ05358.1 conditioned medium-induced protein 4 [Halorhabdus tiamatea SARL4B]CCQ33628.1 conserved hypothetical protein [Halorhabdus tiamatea SARL4B]
MGEKTDELRELFEEVAGTDTVTERQEDERGTLSPIDDERVDGKLREILEDLEETFGFETALSDDQRVELVRSFYRGKSDADLAATLDVEAETVVEARLEVHLFRESDTDTPVPWDDFRRRLRECDNEAIVEEFDLGLETVRHYRAVAEARDEARSVSHRFRSAYRDAIPDADLAEPLTTDATEDGLEEAAADIETDVSF